MPKQNQWGTRSFRSKRRGEFLKRVAADGRQRVRFQPSELPLDVERGLESGLALAGINSTLGPNEDDGRLTAREIANMDLSGTELVFLSGCDTASGDTKTGEGVRGMRRAFQIAGAATVVGSLWPADDTSTKELAKEFYRLLRKGHSRTAALREAPRRMASGKLMGPQFRNPHYWANFVLVGDPSALKNHVH